MSRVEWMRTCVDPKRETVAAPFNYALNGATWDCATDGFALVALRGGSAFDSADSPPRALPTLLACEPEEARPVKISELRAWLDAHQECAGCQGEGGRECLDCEGDGELAHQCSRCREDHVVRCNSCFGEGWVACSVCENRRRPTWGWLLDRAFDLRRLRRFLAGIDVDEGSIGVATDMLVIHAGPWKVMAIHQPTWEHERANAPTFKVTP